MSGKVAGAPAGVRTPEDVRRVLTERISAGYLRPGSGSAPSVRSPPIWGSAGPRCARPWPCWRRAAWSAGHRHAATLGLALAAGAGPERAGPR
jgi:hypothetical protein